MVRTIKLFIEKFKNYTLDTIIAVGSGGGHSHTELFTISHAKWQDKNDYPYAQDIYGYSIMAVEKTFIIFGGYSYKRKVLTKPTRKS